MSWKNAPVTRIEVENAIGAGNAIMTIKYYRDISGSSLKDSKDAIDAVWPFDYILNKRSNPNVGLIMCVFDELVGEPKPKTKDEALWEAVDHMHIHYKVLGFNSFCEGMWCIMANFHQSTPEYLWPSEPTS